MSENSHDESHIQRQEDWEQSYFNTESKTALNGLANKFVVYPDNKNRYDLLTFFTNVSDLIHKHVKQRCKVQKALKWYLSLHVQMVRYSNEEMEETADPHFHSGTFTLLHSEEDLSDNVNDAIQKQFKSFNEYMRRGSGWTLHSEI